MRTAAEACRELGIEVGDVLVCRSVRLPEDAYKIGRDTITITAIGDRAVMGWCEPTPYTVEDLKNEQVFRTDEFLRSFEKKKSKPHTVENNPFTLERVAKAKERRQKQAAAKMREESICKHQEAIKAARLFDDLPVLPKASGSEIVFSVKNARIFFLALFEFVNKVHHKTKLLDFLSLF